MEDHNLIQHIKASLLDISKPVCSKKSSSAPHSRDDGENPMPVEVDDERAVRTLKRTSKTREGPYLTRQLTGFVTAGK